MHPDVPFPPHDNSKLSIIPEPGKLDELHLYHGSKCNRACAFCCVSGEPGGSHTPFTEVVLQAAMRIVARHGSIKIYGGEPTLDAENLRWTVLRLRKLGLQGPITIFSNGLLPHVLTGLVDSDPNLYVVLNYAITTGNGETPLPRLALAHLRNYHQGHPNRLFLSHDFIVRIGRETREAASLSPPHPLTSSPPQPCYCCHPVLTSAGRFHACPFAVEYERPHFRLGDVATPPNVVRERYARFLTWVTDRLEPEAARQCRHVCAVCTGPNPPAYTNATETVSTRQGLPY